MQFQAKLVIAVLAFCAVALCVEAQVPFFGGCPTKRVVEDFDASAYLGRWYEIEKYYAVFEADGKCIQAYYSDAGNGTIGVMNTQINRKTRRMKSIQGVARFTGSESTAKFGVRFPTVPFVADAPYWVLDTDYKNYSIVWSCNDFAVANFQIVWVLAREREPSPEIRDTIREKMDQFGIRRDLLQKTDQTNCDA
ncbi:Apolipoprotein D [Orchesella cincta]|uniref:Apolipoprotein D n=1 Tax=Orchesella cincta TaxID=48709 RepID=A0A1D2MCK2_ORCCI|nr:Apolipoprotein D [Orchesella cincta]